MAIENARRLVESAKRENANGRPSLADFLRTVAEEETGKSVMLLEAHLLSDLGNWQNDRGGWPDFWKEFLDHEIKTLASAADTFRYGPLPPLGGGKRAAPADLSAIRCFCFEYDRPVPAPNSPGPWRAPKAGFLLSREVCLYVDYNPDYRGGSFVGPADIDSDATESPEIAGYLTRVLEPNVVHRAAMLSALDGTWGKERCEAIKRAFANRDEPEFRRHSGWLLHGEGNRHPATPAPEPQQRG